MVIHMQLMYVSRYLRQVISSEIQLHQSCELQHRQREAAEIVVRQIQALKLGKPIHLTYIPNNHMLYNNFCYS